ncbi:hypothetical protein AZH53_01490 [Methanomicrobiaceae archaeon CYW5]|uniref:DUF7544 domain-containing protein n=1 Tax=Methanovulcanius yangii TaxID=1789227 RepID=UPI0029C9B418|nr:hypothetical protein [Methanovulcanius yangii]MBT8507103.1 hypothetical protein [Methanovulcanius yangii]
MSTDYYAFRAIDQAVVRTKNILLPVQRGVWLRLALIALFVGGSAGGFEMGWQNDAPTFPQGLDTIDLSAFGQELPAVALAIIAFGIAYALISGIFQFVFFDAIREDRIVIKDYFRKEIRNGMRYFGFLFAISALLFFLLFIPAALVLSGMVIVDAGTVFQRVVLVIGYIAYAVILGFPYLMIVMFTTDFVVPIMRIGRCGILAGWSRCVRLFEGMWNQAAVYAGMKILFVLLMSIVVGLMVAITAGCVGVPVFLILAGEGWPSVGIGWYTVLFAAYICLVAFSGLLFSVPFITFLRCYSLYVLEYLNPGYEVFGEFRQQHPDR